MAKFSTIKFKGIKYGNPLIGMPIPWPLAVMPQDIWPDMGMVFLPMTGQAFNSTTYPKLALAYPSLIITDMRADFIRGWDNGRGVDSGRALLTAQGDAIRNITGSLSVISEPSGAGGAFRSTENNVNLTINGGSPYGRNIHNFDASRVVPTATENRPRNTAFNYIVRAA